MTNTKNAKTLGAIYIYIDIFTEKRKRIFEIN